VKYSKRAFLKWFSLHFCTLNLTAVPLFIAIDNSRYFFLSSKRCFYLQEIGGKKILAGLLA